MPVYIIAIIALNFFIFRTLKILFTRGFLISPIGGWLLGIFYFLCIPFSIILINEGYQIKYGMPEDIGKISLVDYDNLFHTGFIAVSIFVICFIIHFFLIIDKKTCNIKYLINCAKYNELKKILYLCFSMCTIGWILAVYAAGSLEIFLNSYWYTRMSPISDLIGPIGLTIYSYTLIANQVILVAIGSIYIVKNIVENNEFGFNAMSVAIFSFLFLEMIMTGNRFSIAIFGLLLISWGLQLRLKKQLYLAIFLIPLVISFFSLWQFLRGHLGELDFAFEGHQNRMEIEHPYITPVMDTVEGSSVVFLFHIIDTYGTRTDYLYGSSYLRILNIFGAEKGDNFSVVLAKEFLDGEDTSLTSTILGEPYANLGMASIFIVILETLAFYLISKFSRNNIQIKTIFFVIAILCMRYYFSVVFIIIFFTLLLYYMFKKLSKISIIN